VLESETASRILLVAVALSVLVGGTGWDAMTGNMVFEGCENWPHGPKSDAVSAFKVGTCVGYVWGVAGALEGSSFCLKGEYSRPLVQRLRPRALDKLDRSRD